MLADSAFLQQKDAEFVNRRRAHRKVASAATTASGAALHPEDAERHLSVCFSRPAGRERKKSSPGFTYKTYDAGHMLGSTAMIVEADGVRLGFSGDVGRRGLPICATRRPLDAVDYLIMESTYGDRLHKPLGHAAEKLADVVTRTAARGGKIIVPAFAVGRTQQLVLILHQLMDAKRIPVHPDFRR